ncbi:Flp pilus assembly complex ATPase component TadA [Candidatus Gracilibacteria bacterium]|nr:Flp pilus assembly complex ATPase component TadA [Candidatus Gracilibacteria bacterium]
MKTIEKYFNENTMSVHIKTGAKIFAKKGMPGNVEFTAISKTDTTETEADRIVDEIITYGENFGYFDQKKDGVVVLQIDHYRITITTFPLSEATEITIVKPVKRLGVDDYGIDEKLKERFLESAEGILVAGAPGSGKSTFIQALVDFYDKNGKIIKTLESPRDLQVPHNVTQYSMKHAEHDTIRDILLLSRPDYVFFDEIRNHKDFGFYSDLRLSGIGMVGIVHATKPIDAIQRFVGKLDLGMIPSVIDTVVFIQNGGIEKILTLKYEMKAPIGMEERDLVRPVISISDFETGREEYEIYTFGEETVVMPIPEEYAQNKEEQEKINKIFAKECEEYFKENGFLTEVVAKSTKKIQVKILEGEKNFKLGKKFGKKGKKGGKIFGDKGAFIGKKGVNIQRFEEVLRTGIDVIE